MASACEIKTPIFKHCEIYLGKPSENIIKWIKDHPELYNIEKSILQKILDGEITHLDELVSNNGIDVVHLTQEN